MASEGLIVGGFVAVGVGLGLLWWFRKKAPPKSASTCDDICTATGDPGGHSVCVAACNLGGGILGEAGKLGSDIVGSLSYNSSEDGAKRHDAERDRREKLNRQLNGKPKTPTPWFRTPPEMSRAIDSPVLEYANGCVPFAYASGWAKCKPGTLDMYVSAVDQAANGSDASNFEADLWVVAPRLLPGDPQVKVHVDKGAMMTGLPRDAATWGPRQADDGTLQWSIAGEVVHCSDGSAPVAAVLASQGVTDHRMSATDLAKCVSTSSTPWKSGATIDPATGTPTLCGGPGEPPCSGGPDDHSRTGTGTCPPPPGITFDPITGAWRRMNAGEAQNLGPCAPTPTLVRASVFL